MFIAAAAICFVMATSHFADPSKSFIQSIAAWLTSHQSLKWLGEFIRDHGTQTLGAICYGVTVFTTAPRKNLPGYLALAIAAAYLIADKTLYGYMMHCVAAAMFFKATRKDVRMVILVLSVVAWVLMNK